MTDFARQPVAPALAPRHASPDQPRRLHSRGADDRSAARRRRPPAPQLAAADSLAHSFAINVLLVARLVPRATRARPGERYAPQATPALALQRGQAPQA